MGTDIGGGLLAVAGSASMLASIPLFMVYLPFYLPFYLPQAGGRRNGGMEGGLYFLFLWKFQYQIGLFK
jgi:hypothetical protein